VVADLNGNDVKSPYWEHKASLPPAISLGVEAILSFGHTLGFEIFSPMEHNRRSCGVTNED
jgi:hypothetical protein